MTEPTVNSDAVYARKIIHVDMDAFYASVEQRDNPALQGKPVIVGGRPNGRGVVAACSYEAREFGIHSAMPSAEAGRRCPHAEFVKPRFSAYQQVSKQIRDVFHEFTPHVEPLSLDEAYLDVTDQPLLGGSAVRMAREIKTLIRERCALVASAGVSYNKFLAKIASDMDKPDGLFCVLPADGESFVASLPIGRFYGVGRATEARMHELGIRTGADLRVWKRDDLMREFGRSADYYYHVARGIDMRPVRASRERKSMGSERTFATNLTSTQEMLAVLEELCRELWQGLQEKQLMATSLTIKVRLKNFHTFTRSHTEPQGFRQSMHAERVLPFLLDRALDAHEAPAIRLLGVSMSGLQPEDVLQTEQLELPFASE